MHSVNLIAAIMLLMGAALVTADAAPPKRAQVVIYTSGSATSANEMRYFVIEVGNLSKQPIRLPIEAMPNTFFDRDFTPLPIASGEVNEAWYEIVVDNKDRPQSGIHITQLGAGPQQVHYEVLAPSRNTLTKVSVLSNIAPPGSHCRIKCRLRTKDAYICESDWVTFDYLP